MVAVSEVRFSAVMPFSRSSVPWAWMEGAREGAAVFTAVEGVESRISLSIGVESEVGSEKTTILIIFLYGWKTNKSSNQEDLR